MIKTFLVLVLLTQLCFMEWVQYTENKYISLYPLDTFKVPNLNGLYNITHISSSQVQPYTFHYFLLGQNNLKMALDFSSNLTRQINILQTYNYIAICLHTPRDTLSTNINQIYDIYTNQMIFRKVSTDYSQRNDQNMYFINTTKTCKIRLQLNSPDKHTLYLIRPGDYTPQATRIIEVDNNDSVKIIQYEINQPGLWGVGVEKKQRIINNQLSQLRILTDSQNACQNLCYGDASLRGSSGWNFDGSQCVCSPGTYFNPFFGCSQIFCEQYSPYFPNQCGCPQGTTYDIDYKYCRSEQCQQKQIWNQQTQQCQLYCGSSIIPNSIEALDNGQICSCQTKYKWNNITKQCELNCGSNELPYSLSLQSNSCSCIQKYHWNSTIKQCILSCGLDIIPNSLVNFSHQTFCNCEKKFIWNSNFIQCELNCLSNTQIPNAISLSQNRDSCICDVTYQWSRLSNACVCQDGYNCLISCSSLPHTIDSNEQSNSCQCQMSYYWDQSEGACLLKCQGQYQVAITQNNQSCICQLNSYWSPTQERCIVICRQDILSTGEYRNDICICIQYSDWNNQINRCGCIDGYKLDRQNNICILSLFDQDDETNQDQQRQEQTDTSYTSLWIFVGIAGLGLILGIGTLIKNKFFKKQQLNQVDQAYSANTTGDQQVAL